MSLVGTAAESHTARRRTSQCQRALALSQSERPDPREQTMRHKLAWSVTAAAAVMLSQAALQPASTQKAVALTGQVTSEAEGAMEGVVVSAKKQGSIIKVSVTTDEQGRYSFPEERLEPGEYTITIRAVGYDI